MGRQAGLGAERTSERVSRCDGAVVFRFLVAADAVAAVLRTIAAQSASFVQINIFVSWFVGGDRCSASGRIDARPSYVAHRMGWCRRCRTGRDTKAPGSIPARGKQVREAARMRCSWSRSSSLLPYDRVFRLDQVNDAACAGMKP